MLVIPAIDIQGGRFVRLYQGDFAKSTVYGEDPVEMAAVWQARGARLLHVVDLDGAATGEPCNLTIVARIAETLQIPVQLGGGLRKMEDLRQAFAAGISRVILGTAAIEDPALLTQSLETFGADRIVVSLDARGGLVATHGWQKVSSVPAVDLAQRLVAAGVSRFVYTDISRDGTLTSPNFEAIGELLANVAVPVIASGGISRESDLQRLASTGVEAAIVGKALYTEDLKLETGFEIKPSK